MMETVVLRLYSPARICWILDSVSRPWSRQTPSSETDDLSAVTAEYFCESKCKRNGSVLISHQKRYSDEVSQMRRELTLFLIVGSTSSSIDFLIYSAILHSSTIGISFAKGLSFLVGTVFTYLASRFWTFGHTDHEPGSPWRFGILYILTLIANVAINEISLKYLSDVRFSVPFAFLITTGISASLNFFGMKWFVFKASTVSEAQ